ncbi:hypothetical protein JAAARDRAFT_62642 [Jaapia argillacea MUCL 33604]|uniref:Protein-S-isoprenylcysteine O-methyltransferase n=1 Tax=Jaapia argillacea MUCL 33604 TaxID=933084 RepID=A0A067PJM8_9AGAM|nr:hypothetical protein JAAARDRAFT_62642 [Jaapia argillacea MUCL 33604]
MTVSLLKIPLLLGVATIHHIAFKPPNKTPSSKELSSSGGWESVIRGLLPFLTLFRSVIWVVTLSEVTVILAQQYPSSPIARQIMSSLIRRETSSASSITLTEPFCVGFLLAVSSGLLRYWCFRQLGQFFTFQLSIRRDHRLITQGPYSIVRHPSYTSALICASGVYIALLSRGSWLRESGVLDYRIVQVALVVCGILRGASHVGLVFRTVGEDAMLRKNFGTEWDEWARRVRYRLVPGVY